MLDFTAASQVPIQKVLSDDDSFDFSVELSDFEDSPSSPKQPQSAYQVSAQADSPLEDSVGSEADVDPESPRKTVNLPAVMILPFSSPGDKSTQFTEPAPEETRDNWGLTAGTAKHAEDLKQDDSIDVAEKNIPDFTEEIPDFTDDIPDFTAEIPDSTEDIPPPCSDPVSNSETNDELPTPAQLLEKSYDLSLKCAAILRPIKETIAARRITRAVRRFLRSLKKRRGTLKMRSICDKTFGLEWEEFKHLKEQLEREARQNTLLRAVVRGWRTRLILNKSAKVRLLKDKLKFALPLAVKRLKAELIATLHLELSEGAKLKPRKPTTALVTRRRASKRADTTRKQVSKTANRDTYSATLQLGASKSQSKMPTHATLVTPKNRSEAPQLRRQNSLDEFCMLELLSKQLTQTPQHLQVPQLPQTPQHLQIPQLTLPNQSPQPLRILQPPMLSSPTKSPLLKSPLLKSPTQAHRSSQSSLLLQLSQAPLPHKPTQSTQIPQPPKLHQPTNIPQPLLSPRGHKVVQVKSPKPPQKAQQPKLSLKVKVPPKPKPLSKLESNLPFALKLSPRLKSVKTRNLSAKNSSESLLGRRRSLSKVPVMSTKQQQHTLEAARSLLCSVAVRSFDDAGRSNLV
jgi:hypothetical protein